MNRQNVLVLGEGVTGLSTALKLLQAGHQVTVLGKAAELSPKSYALCTPYTSAADPRVFEWSQDSYQFFKRLSEDHETGVSLRSIIRLFVEKEEPWWAGKVEGYRHPLPDEIPSPEYKDASILERWPVIDPLVFLSWLRRQVVALGGTFVHGHLSKWSDCPVDFSVIANCAGNGAKQLVNDEELKDEQIQIVRIRKKGFESIESVWIDDAGPHRTSCVVPHDQYLSIGVLIGGSTDSSMAVDLANTADILSRASAMLPGFQPKLSDVESIHRVRRPTRSLPRVEIEQISLDGRTLHVAHNYGAWGLAYCLIESSKWIGDAVSKL